MNKKDFAKNVITGFGGQLIVIILGIIIPRIMISSYGSDINGLVATTTQIFSYLALLEAGIGQSARIALYKPISERNQKDISDVVKSAESYFRRITRIYGICVILLCVVSPYVIKTEVSFSTVFFVFLFEGLSGVFSFYYIQTPSILLNADGKSYINNTINLANKILGYIIKILLAYMGINIIIVQFSYFLITIMKVAFYRLYIKKQYSWISHESTPNYNLLKDKNSYVLTEIAWTIFSSTDMIVLSIFVSTKLSSVYSVYCLIYNSIYLLMNAVGGSVLYVLGQVYHRNMKEYEIVHDSMNTIFIGSITILMSVSNFLTIPFIRLYTDGVADVEYIYSQLPIMFALVQMLSWSRYINGNLTGLAGYARTTSYISLIEAIVNVALSVLLVNRYGIVGVLLATVVALPIKVIWCVYISDKKVLKRSYINTIKIFGCNYLFFALIVLLRHYIVIDINSYGSFLIYGFTLTIIIGLLGCLVNILVNRNCLRVIRNYLIKRK